MTRRLEKGEYSLVTVTVNGKAEYYFLIGSKTAREKWIREKSKAYSSLLRENKSVSFDTTSYLNVCIDFDLPCRTAYLVTASVNNGYTMKIVKEKRNVLPEGERMLEKLLHPLDVYTGRRKRSFTTPLSCRLFVDRVTVLEV